MSSLTASSSLDVKRIRDQFPVLLQKIHGKDLIYFDNAATTQKPSRVIDALTEYYESYNANIHRGIHTLAEKATKAFEDTRSSAQKFVNAKHTEEIIFTTGVTGSINLVAASYGKIILNAGDEVIISGMEHHSNIVPWQLICEERGASLKVIPISPSGELVLDEFHKLLCDRTRIVAVNHASNSLGTINHVKEIIVASHHSGAAVLIDGAQAAAHLEIDVQALDCDFYCLSAHKMYGPTGVGILYGKKSLLEKMPPYMGGGEMIRNVTFDKTTFNDLPYKFEAGTPNIADVVAFRQAIEFVQDLGKENIASHEKALLSHATHQLSQLPGLKLIGTSENKVALQSFNIEGVHPFDVGQMLDARGIAVRTGHHCTQPLMDILGVEGTVRASFAVYNSMEEIDQMIEGIERVIKFMR